MNAPVVLLPDFSSFSLKCFLPLLLFHLLPPPPPLYSSVSGRSFPFIIYGEWLSGAADQNADSLALTCTGFQANSCSVCSFRKQSCPCQRASECNPSQLSSCVTSRQKVSKRDVTVCARCRINTFSTLCWCVENVIFLFVNVPQRCTPSRLYSDTVRC